jgi:hypothetical protein
MQYAEQIKHAPETGRSQRIFQNFTAATYALLDCPDTPDELCEAITDAIQSAGAELITEGEESVAGEARRTLTRIFGLGDEGGDPDGPHDEESQAAGEIAEAFATLIQRAEYLPDAVYPLIVEAIAEIGNSARWMDSPRTLREMLPALLKGASKKVDSN